ncbi:F-box protein [Quillaja saponaria]|uniref:F-box protein n=1 Tax=Quillaja saponaria TaxID=32244 RepID=A0AAD7LP43_QUISA|nr:F-box protein [Quillaja saponaria]
MLLVTKEIFMVLIGKATFGFLILKGLKQKTKLFSMKVERFVSHIEQAYLVELSGELLAVLPIEVEARPLFEGSTICTYGTTQVLVLELNISNGSCTRLTSLGNRALFVGHNLSTFVNATNIFDCKANSIYFTDDAEDFYLAESDDKAGSGEDEFHRDLTECGGGRDIGV